jgi:hemolysin-activating ACP:hemolysin acyltransferase
LIRAKKYILLRFRDWTSIYFAVVWGGVFMSFFGSKKSAPAEKSAGAVVENGKLAKAAILSSVGVDKAQKPSKSGGTAEPDQRQRRVAALLRLSAAFTQTVTLLMRSSLHKHMAIADLEWLVLPPLLAGQFRIAKVGSKKTGVVVPAGVVLWASVSPEVDKKLSENAAAPLRLRPDEWRSGDIIWLVEAAGDPRVVSKLLTELNASVFKNRDVKVRTREAGNPAFGTLQKLVSKALNS